MSKLSKREIVILVNRYIGVSGGYLGDFSYRTHAEFYIEYCDLDIDVRAKRAHRTVTTRDLFVEILEEADAADQARIVEGVLRRNPPSTQEEKDLAEQMASWMQRLRGVRVTAPQLTSTESVEEALTEAERAITAGNPVAAVDRTHTALHGFIKAHCEAAGLQPSSTDKITSLFKALRAKRPDIFTAETIGILNPLASIIHNLNELRNQKSLAHPTDNLLSRDEALLAINSARTAFVYLDAKLN